MPERRPRPARGVPSVDVIRQIVDHAGDLILRVRLLPRPRVEYVNRAVAALTGHTPEQISEDPAYALRQVHPSDRRKLLDIGRSGRLPRQPLTVRIAGRHGDTVAVAVVATPVYNRAGALVAIDAIARHVPAADPKRADAPGDIKMTATLFDQAPIGLAHVARDGRLLRVNRRVCDLTGYTAPELAGRRLQDFTHPDDVEREAAILQQVSAKEISSYSVEKRCLSKDGSPVWVRVNATYPRGSGQQGGIAVIDRVAPPGSRDAEQGRLAYNGIELDTDRLEVTWNARSVALTLKEVLLLRYLIRHRGEMLPRDRLLRDVWGYKYSGRSRTLDVHVCRLRRKLPPLATSLVTIGHFGYTLSHDALVSAPMVAEAT